MNNSLVATINYGIKSYQSKSSAYKDMTDLFNLLNDKFKSRILVMPNNMTDEITINSYNDSNLYDKLISEIKNFKTKYKKYEEAK